MTVAGLTTPVNNAHIHRGAFGVAGGVVINFSPSANLANGKLNATFTLDKTLGDEIAGNAGNFYINVHTSQNPGGEIRGQLTPVGDATPAVR